MRIGIAPGGMALASTSRWQRAKVEVLAERAAGPDQGAIGDQLRELLKDGAAAGMPVTVVLSDELVRLWQVTPPAAATRMSDLEAAAALRFQSLFGASAANWKIAADWDCARPFLAAAVPLALLGELEQLVAQFKFHLVEIVPQFVAALNQWRKHRKHGAWFALVHDGVLTIAAYDADSLAAVRATPIAPGADRDWLESFIAREALRIGLSRPECLQLCGPAPLEWVSSRARANLACSILEEEGAHEHSALARLALTGSGA
ncbi:hypothetical protein E4O92_04310 [Massilia horti]|uniref:Uncharacterized protein n=1 Tax=Massilia horti TaxID=2562153 RepID=A0A4Y9T8P6_9BURK|nr:hypothetical protein E4O92_04310 [Massilia horti]